MSTALMFDNGNKLELRNGWTTENGQLGINYPTPVRIYSQYDSAANNKVICIINPDGRVIRDGIDITDNDAAMAACFVEQLKTFHNIEVKRGS